MKNYISYVLISLAGILSNTAQSAVIDIDGRLMDSTEESALEWGDNSSTPDSTDAPTTPAPVSDDDGTVALTVTATIQDWRTPTSAGTYDAGEEWNVRSDSTATTAAQAFTDGAYFEISLASSGTFTWDSVSASIWRNGTGADSTFQFAVDADGDGFTTDDLVDSAMVLGAGITEAGTISYSGTALPSEVASGAVRLYHWGSSNANGNFHLYDVSADYTAVSNAPPVEAERPNIIVIFMDDLGYNDIGTYTYPDPPNQYPISGPEPQPVGTSTNIPEPNVAYGNTPRIDSLATNGITMTQFYASPRCSSARASLLSGRYDARTGVRTVFYPDHTNGYSTEEVTVAELLRQEGYTTAMVGKWHLGFNPSVHNPYQMMPLRHGFQEFFGFPHSNDMEEFHLVRDEAIVEANFDDPSEQAQITWLYTEEALDFIERSTAKDKPFFLYLAHSMTHRPTYPSDQEYTNADGTTWPKFEGTSGVSYYYDVVNEVDHSTGRILDKLVELGIDEDTLVIFTSDNGPWTTVSNMNLEEISCGSAYPLRGGKLTTWEGGCRVPCVVQWPGHIPPGSVSGEITGLIDLLPTFVELAGGDVPTDRTIDGVDLSGLWTAESGWANPRSFYALYNTSGGAQAILKGDYKLRSGALYNLVDDIQESTDLSSSEPAVLADLEAEASALASSISADSNSKEDFSSYEVELQAADVFVKEGGSVTVDVRLSADPGKTVVVNVARFSGDSELSVSSGANLTFDSTNWSITQPVTITALQNGVYASATFRVTTDDISHVRELFVFETDDPITQVELVWPKVQDVGIASSEDKLVLECAVQVGTATNPAGTTYEWEMVTGPGEVSFTDGTANRTGVSFSENGFYQLRIMADHPSAAASDRASLNVYVGSDEEVEILTYKYDPVLAYGAAQDTDADNIWEELLGSSTRNWTLDGDVVRTTSDPAEQLSFIDAAYVFPGGSIPDAATADDLDAYGNSDASLEFWFKPDALPVSSPQVLWESGGDVGSGMVIEGSMLRFAVDGSSVGAVAEATLSPSAAQDGFVHCVGVIDLSNDEVRLYLDGALVDTKSIAGLTDWCGTSQSGLGTISDNGGNETTDFEHIGGNDLLSGTYGTFAGQMAWMLFYDQALTITEVTNLVSGPATVSTSPVYTGNRGPVAMAGTDQTLDYIIGINLNGTVQDDGLPVDSVLSTLWDMKDGPGSADIADPSQPSTTMNVDASGMYQLWLEADDGEIKVYNDTHITVDSLNYMEWSAHIGLPAGQDGAGDNPDGDSFKNYWEWVLGQDPESYDLPIAIGEVSAAGASNTVNFTFSFDIPRDRAPDLDLEVSEDLSSWTTISNQVPRIEVLDAETSRWTYALEVDADSFPRLFARPVGHPE